MVERFLEIFMDDFSIYGDSFNQCLHHLELVLQRCKKKNLTLNWEKYHFMVRWGIVLGHEISRRGIEVNKAKIEVISKLSPPKCIKDIRSFLAYRWILLLQEFDLEIRDKNVGPEAFHSSFDDD